MFRNNRGIVFGLAVCWLTGGLWMKLPHLNARAAEKGKAEKAGGPKEQPYRWRNVEIVGGGFVSGLVFSPIQKDLLYARTDIGGAYRWNATTRRWIPLNDFIGQPEGNLFGTESIGVDPTDPNRVYLAQGTYTQSWASNGAIFRSDDQGRTWQRTDLPIKLGGNEDGRSIGERLVVDPNKNNVLYFGSRKDGLWKSMDYAASWSKVASFPIASSDNGIGVGIIVYDYRSGASGNPTPVIYVGVDLPGGPGLYRSKNAGVTWEAVSGQPKGFLPHHAALDANGILYLTYGDGPGPNGMSDGAVWKLDTKSDTWSDITPIKPGSEGVGHFGYAGLALDAQHPGTLLVSTMDKWSSGDDIYRTTDGGAHWTALRAKSERDSSGSPFVNFGNKSASFGWWIGALALDPFRPDHVLYGTGATIWGSDDGTAADKDAPTHWTVRAQGLEETAVQALLSPPTGPHLISGLGDIGGFRHDDLAVSPQAGMWTNPMISSTDGLAFAEKAPDIVVRVGGGKPGERGAISRDGAKSWTPFPAEPAGSKGGGSIAVAADGSVMLWSPNGGSASYSTDRGATWTLCKGVPARVWPVADRENAKAFYALDAEAGELYVSLDSGVTFAARATALPKRSRLYTPPGRTGDLWLTGGNGGLLHSMDAGMTFTKLEYVQAADTIGFGMAAPEHKYPALYLVGKINDVAGVFRSDDEGANWVRVNDDRHQYGWIGQAVTGDPRIYGRVYLATNGRGILYADPVQGK